MMRRNVTRFVESLDVDALLTFVSSRYIRAEPRAEAYHGVTSLVTHTLHMNAETRGWHRIGSLEHNPTSLLTEAGHRVAIVSEFIPSLFGGYTVYAGLVAEPGCTECADRHLSWESTAAFEPALDVRIGSFRHLVEDHLDRYAGASSAQARARFSRALHESLLLVRAGGVEVASYWYRRGGNHCHVIPLQLGAEWEPVAAVLNRDGDEYVVVTTLSLHDAFWNVATTGQVPPTWLQGDLAQGAA